MDYYRLLYRFDLDPKVLDLAKSDPGFAEFVYHYKMDSKWGRWRMFWMVMLNTIPSNPWKAVKHLVKALRVSLETVLGV